MYTTKNKALNTFSLQSLRAFTLIELSIVLVIIGLIVGGVLVGQDLIKAAQVRAQLSQIEKYNTAVNSFRGKYNGLPGDLNAALAAQFGFVSRAGTLARGDGNGEVESMSYGNSTVYDWNQGSETFFFWEDLSQAGLVEGQFNTATDAQAPVMTPTGAGSANLNNYLPQAKIGNGNYLYVYSGVPYTGLSGPNYFALSVVNMVDLTGDVVAYTAPGLTVQQAYGIDRKIDDGYPSAGNVLAQYPGGYGSTGTNYNGISVAGYAPADTSTTCYNNSVPSGIYSIAYNGGAGRNCGLSIKIQGMN